MAGKSINGFKDVFAFEKLTVNGSTSLTSTVYRSGGVDNAVPRKIAQYAFISVDVDQIRFRTDGTAPDSTTGHLMDTGDSILLEGENNISNFKAIKITNNATIQVSYS